MLVANTLGNALAMTTPCETSDVAILDLLRQADSMDIAQLASATHVTPTAVRQRLSRLMDQGLIDRDLNRAGRGRPSHRYHLTEKGLRRTGNNFSDLALVLWKEIRAVKDPEVRRGLYKRISGHLAAIYSDRVRGNSPVERMQSVAELFAERDVPVRVEQRVGKAGEQLPVLTAMACPYPQLAEQDRGICALERMLFSELLERDVRLSACRLDGDSCCRFETN